MNYFERLIRRTLMQPANKPGGALNDPFENVEDWPLEVVAAAPTQREASMDTTSLRVESVARHTDEEGRTAPEVKPLVVPAIPASVAVSRLADTSVTGTPDTVPALVSAPAMAVSLDPPPNTESSPALDLADQFMRTLGVPVPERLRQMDIAPADNPSEPVGVPFSAKLEPRQERTYLVSPPPSPQPNLPIVEQSQVAGGTGRTSEPGALHEQELQPRAPAVVETRRVVCVERQSNGRVDAAASGGGSPRFGLGQL